MKKYVLAFVSGLLNGVFGTGGGTVALPMLYDALDNEKKAHQSVALFILPLSIISVSISSNFHKVGGLGLVCLGAFVGGIIGAVFSKKIKTKYLKIVFGLVILYIGVKSIL